MKNNMLIQIFVLLLKTLEDDPKIPGRLNMFVIFENKHVCVVFQTTVLFVSSFLLFKTYIVHLLRLFNR